MVEKARSLTARNGRPLGHPTRGTTAANRMRRVDRWLTGTHSDLLRGTERPFAVDLGYGASHVTPSEMLRRIRRVAPEAELTGLEIEPSRVESARLRQEPGLSFELGGFEIPTPRRPHVIRAFNVLRQYEEADVSAIWETMRSRLAPEGVLLEGTCDEIGRLAAWVTLGPEGPRTLTLAVNPWRVERPSDVAERLPKALIHRNVPGERIHEFFLAADRAWLTAAPHGAFSPRQRWMATASALASAGWVLGAAPWRAGSEKPRVYGGQARFRLGEMTLPWEAVAPAD